MKSLSVTLSPPDRGFHPVDGTISEVEHASRRQLLYVDVLDDESCLLVYLLSGGEPGTLRGAIDDHPAIIRNRLSTYSGSHHLYAHARHGQPLVDIFRAVERHALLYKRPIPFRDGRMTVTIGGTESALQRALDDLPERVGVDVERVGDYDPGVDGILALLTERQREALTAALESGYYDTPRAATCADVGAALGCAPSTANDRLREAERTVLSTIRI
jgi:hypothetical protein